MPEATLELEFAVVRGGEYLYRSVLLEPSVFSIGTHSLAVVSAAVTQFPEYHELVELQDGVARLRFDSRMAVELSQGGGFVSASSVVEDGRAQPRGEGWEVELKVGSKAVARFGPIQVLLKVRAKREATVVDVPMEGDSASCADCGAPLRWVLDGRGVLTPCGECRTLNRVRGTRARMLDGDAFATVPATRSFVEEIDEELEETVADDLNPVQLAALDAEASRRESAAGKAASAGADLPTFDAMSALSDSASGEPDPRPHLGPQDPAPVDHGEFATTDQFAGSAALAAVAMGPEAGPAADSAGAADFSPLPASAGSAALGLPTFDAISALKETEHLSTAAAMSALKDGDGQAVTDFFEVVDDELPAAQTAEDEPEEDAEEMAATTRSETVEEEAATARTETVEVEAQVEAEESVEQSGPAVILAESAPESVELDFGDSAADALVPGSAESAPAAAPAPSEAAESGDSEAEAGDVEPESQETGAESDETESGDGDSESDETEPESGKGESAELDDTESEIPEDDFFLGGALGSDVFDPQTVPGNLSNAEKDLVTGAFAFGDDTADATVSDGLVKGDKVWIGEYETAEEGEGDDFFLGVDRRPLAPLPNSGRGLYIFGVVAGILGIGLLLAAYLQS